MLVVYALYVFVCVFGNWYYKKKYPEKYLRGADGKIIQTKSYFLKDILAEKQTRGVDNKSFEKSK